MNKPIIFISHITEEKELALEIKALLEESFLGMMDIFVSSDDTSISAGTRWLDNISSSLGNCSIELILCSPKSVKRPWINFEAGAGWVRNIPVVPLCHSGMEPNNLPIPLNLLQAIKLSEISGLKLLLPLLSSSIGSKEPNVDFCDFVNKVKDFEENYTFWDDCNKYFEKLLKINPNIVNALKQGQNIQIELLESQINYLEQLIEEFFNKHELIKFIRTGTTSIRGTGMYFTCFIEQTEKLRSILGNPKFKV
ncbi:toll/interleukin-1 receptor domain-containing protein [Clostridium perfringens]|uniref:toll/interleukin-1 receptor domain-containing protein n=1 Tax=Clostridium perfringens TaxID=1502 RepID=UPI0039EC321E